jgi:hypothetical protein
VSAPGVTGLRADGIILLADEDCSKDLILDTYGCDPTLVPPWQLLLVLLLPLLLLLLLLLIVIIQSTIKYSSRQNAFAIDIVA